MADWPFWAAVQSAKQGLSGSSGLRRYRSGGGAVANQTWFRMMGEARRMLGERGDEIGRPLNRRPLAEERQGWTTRKAKGFMQNVEVMVRDRDTNEIIPINYSLRSNTLRSRQSVIDLALGTITPEGTDGERQQILGAVYVSTWEMTPGG